MDWNGWEFNGGERIANDRTGREWSRWQGNASHGKATDEKGVHGKGRTPEVYPIAKSVAQHLRQGTHGAPGRMRLCAAFVNAFSTRTTSGSRSLTRKRSEEP